jgi:iron complex outermembrane receptor protein
VYDFSLVRGDNLTTDRPLSYMNPDKQILKFEYEKEFMNYNIRLSKIHAQNRLGEFESYTPSSFLVDFIISYRNSNQNITIQFNNIFNAEYYNHLSKIKSIMPEAGRNILINYKLLF